MEQFCVFLDCDQIYFLCKCYTNIFIKIYILIKYF